MNRSPEKFARLLTEAIYRIRLHESNKVRKTVGIVQDELGYTLGREGGSAIEYWRKGHIPGNPADVEKLARELVRRNGFDPATLKQFLQSAGYPNPIQLCEELFTPFPLAEFAPFIVGPPTTHPRHFFGRIYELKRVFSLFRRFPLQNIAIIGAHRSGKTSLLHYVSKITTAKPTELRPQQRVDWLSHPETYQWVFVDFQNAQMCSQAYLLNYLLTSLDLPVPTSCSLNDFMNIISQQLQKPTIILMDEVGAGLSSADLDQQFWWSLRSLGSNYSEGKLGFLLTAHELPALLAQEYGKPSPFFNIFGHILKLGPLHEAEARELINSSPIRFDAADVAWILEQSSRWPALLQILCDTRLTALEEGQLGNGWREEGMRRMEPLQHLLLETG